MLLGALLLSACNSSGENTGFAYDGPVTSAEWSTTASDYRGQDGLLVAFQCAKNPRLVNLGNVWGTDTYSDDSSVCSAGVHAGAITYQDGGLVVFEIRPGLDDYQASIRNGVSSATWGTWGGSFVVR